MNIDIESRPLHILHVDDHSIMADGFRLSVESKMPGVQIQHISNGNDALHYIETCFQQNLPLDLLVTDVSHPGMSGLELCRSIKGLQKLYGRRLPAVVFTMHTDPVILSRIKEMGYLYVPKSGKEISLLAAIWMSLSLN